MFRNFLIILAASLLVFSAGGRESNAELSNSSSRVIALLQKQGGARQTSKPTTATPKPVTTPAVDNSKKAKVDYRSDTTVIMNRGELIKLIGNVAFHHNGAIITCDTAYRYSEQRMEGVGNVIINSDSTYIYGDMFTYNGETNIARIFAPIIKTVDKDVVLYTRNMEFNTKTNIGSYYGGGYLEQRNNIMESDTGEYHTKSRDIVLLGNVAMKNENYVLKSDSVFFNMNSEIVTFNKTAYMWTTDGDFLKTDGGTYITPTEVYDLYDKAYIMTKDQELWADTLNYNSRRKEAELRNNIQILDTTQNVLSFGDYGRYWGNIRKVLLTKKSSAISFDPKNAEDSTFLGADTMVVVPALEFNDSLTMAEELRVRDSLAYADSLNIADSLLAVKEAIEAGIDPATLVKNSDEDSTVSRDSVANMSELDRKIDASLADSLVGDSDSLALPKPMIITDVAQNKEVIKELNRRKREELKAESDSLKNIERQRKIKERLEKRMSRDSAKGKPTRVSAKTLAALDSMSMLKDSLELDSLAADSALKAKSGADSLLVDVDKKIAESISRPVDSSDYIIQGFRNVKIFKKDMQSICDSLTVVSADSTLHLRKNPVIWNANNQITAGYIKLFSKNGEPEHAEMYDFPILAQEVKPGRYNQIRGKYMEAFFKGGDIDIMYVDGNAETRFYKVEKNQLTAFMTALSASMTINFDSSEVKNITWIGDPKHALYPMYKIPNDVSLLLEGFSWEIARRPKSRFEIFNRNIVPSYRSEATAIIKPLFSITESINIEKQVFTDNGTWRDRTDVLPISRDEFTREDIAL